MQREFINIAAHELRTPAQSVLGYAELIKEDIMYNQDKNIESIAALDAIYRNADRLQRLTNDILDVSRIESHTLNLDKEVLDIDDLLLRTIEDCKNTVSKYNRNIDNKKFAVELSYNPSLNSNPKLMIEADRDRINQAVSNLLNNAIKFTSKKGGTIVVTAKKTNEYRNDKQKEVVVNVVDMGEGIDQEMIPRLFSKFASTSNSGTGLGLYIAKNIVESYGGRIWAKNNPDGNGATFSFSLPIIKNSGTTSLK